MACWGVVFHPRLRMWAGAGMLGTVVQGGVTPLTASVAAHKGRYGRDGALRKTKCARVAMTVLGWSSTSSLRFVCRR